MIQQATALDGHLLASLHAAAFPEDPWSAEAFESLLRTPGTAALLTAEDTGTLPEPVGFVLFRATAGEAEIVTIGTLPDRRGRGHGGALLRASMTAATASGAADMFLEVAEDNTAAKTLYARHGFVEVGRRRDYYRRGPDTVDALVLRCALSAFRP